VSDYAAEHKVPPYAIRRMLNTTEGFYELLGPFLARREIVAELGAPVWDDDDKEWFVAVTEPGDVLGMVAVRSGCEVCSFYVIPGSRELLVGYALLHNAVAGRARGTLKATATEASRGLFTLAGFTETGTRGRYFTFRGKP
jgi:hypothetical protein